MKYTKNFIVVTMLLFLSILISFGQKSIIFIEDSADTFGNSRYLATALDSLALDYFYYDTETSGIPELEILTAFDLVIWHTSTWGVGLYFWVGSNTEEHLIKKYLDTPNANLWLIGNDFMFEKYNSAPDNFTQGSFPYDYLGITSYKAQSYGDDGGLGVPYLVPTSPNVIEDLTDIRWVFTHLNWADSYEIRETATPIFEFGDDNYPLKGGITGYFYPRENGSNVMTFGFDLSLCSSKDTMVNTVQKVTNFFFKVSSTNNITTEKQLFKVYPSIITNEVYILTNQNSSKNLSMTLYNTQGQIAFQSKVDIYEGSVKNISIPESLPKGIYYCTLSHENIKETHKLIKI